MLNSQLLLLRWVSITQWECCRIIMNGSTDILIVNFSLCTAAFIHQSAIPIDRVGVAYWVHYHSWRRWMPVISQELNTVALLIKLYIIGRLVHVQLILCFNYKQGGRFGFLTFRWWMIEFLTYFGITPRCVHVVLMLDLWLHFVHRPRRGGRRLVLLLLRLVYIAVVWGLNEVSIEVLRQRLLHLCDVHFRKWVRRLLGKIWAWML